MSTAARYEPRDTVVSPDLVVVCGGVPERHVESPPAIVVEVLSLSTRDHECTVKREVYLRAGVSWHVLIDPDNGINQVLERVANAGQDACHLHEATARCMPWTHGRMNTGRSRDISAERVGRVQAGSDVYSTLTAGARLLGQGTIVMLP